MPRRKPVLAITVVTSSDKPPLRISFNRWVFGLLLLLTLLLVGLASITLYTLLDPQTARGRGDNLSFSRSSNTREQEQEKLIKLSEERLVELQKENAARKKDVDDLEGRVRELSGNIKSLQQLAKEIEQRLPGGPPTTPGGQVFRDNTGGIGGSEAGLGIDPNLGRTYTTQFNKVLNELNRLNLSITNDRLSISTLDVQVQSYRATLSQNKSVLEAESVKLAQLAGAEGNNPPNVLPANCVLTSPFGMRWSPFVSGVRQMHYGVDIGCFEGTPVAATKAGVVSFVGSDSGYGQRVEVSHAGGWLTLYAHNNRILVKVGQIVRKGDIIALSGNTGASTGPHIHYELHQNGLAIDPLKMLAALPVFQT